jgi:hypothetical protein
MWHPPHTQRNRYHGTLVGGQRRNTLAFGKTPRRVGRHHRGQRDSEHGSPSRGHTERGRSSRGSRPLRQAEQVLPSFTSVRKVWSTLAFEIKARDFAVASGVVYGMASTWLALVPTILVLRTRPSSSVQMPPPPLKCLQCAYPASPVDVSRSRA